MSDKPEQIITDDEIIHVHANANFGSMTPREVVNDGVRKYAVGYQGGSTQLAILREHGLITAPKGCGYKANLTEKGKRYARSIYHEKPTLSAAMELPEVKALVETAQWARNRLEIIADESWHGDGRDLKRLIIGIFADFDKALADCGSQVPLSLAAIKEPKT